MHCVALVSLVQDTQKDKLTVSLGGILGATTMES